MFCAVRQPNFFLTCSHSLFFVPSFATPTHAPCFIIRRKEEGDELGLTAKDGPDQLSGRGQDLAAATSTLRLATSASALLRLRPCPFSLDVLQMFCAIRLRSFFLAQHSLFFVPSSATSPHVLCPISLSSLLVRHLSYTLSFLILYSLVPSC